MGRNVVIVSASPRTHANSAALCEEFARGARDAGHAVEVVELRRYKVGMCVGCGACSEQGKPCPLRDDADTLVQKLIDANVVVLATPVYFYCMSAQLKAFIDRTCARYQELGGKDFYFIATMADTVASNMERTFDALRGFTDCLPGANVQGTLCAFGVWKTGEINGTPFLQQAYDMGRSC